MITTASRVLSGDSEFLDSTFIGFVMEASMSAPKNKPMTIITIGMAGAGKSTFVQRINSYLHSLNPPTPPYILNLDPAVTHIPFEANIDIRDTVDYQEVMKQYVSC
jgi:GPN-loop GTPase